MSDVIPRFGLACAIVCAALTSGCVERPQSPRFALLIDLSETWHNDEQRQYNEDLLDAVTDALIATAEWPRFVQPTYRFHVIGAQSLYRPPLCTAVYEPRLIGGDGDPPASESGRAAAASASGPESGEQAPRLLRANTLHNMPDLRAFLGDTCTFYALNQPGEQETQVTAALVTALRSMSPPQGGDASPAHTGPRRIVVLSDLKEEPISTYNLEAEDFSGVDILLIYRALWSDRSDVALVEERERRWRRELEGRGARVFSMPDTGVTAAALRPFLLHGEASEE